MTDKKLRISTLDALKSHAGQNLKISPIRDLRSTPTYCQLQTHVKQKLGQK